MTYLRTVPLLFALLLAGSPRAGTPFVPSELPDGLEPADLVIVGRIHDVTSRPTVVISLGGEGRGAVGKAVLDVTDVLWGAVAPGISLTVNWSESSFDISPIELDGIEEGQLGIFFLACASHLKDADHGFRCRIAPDQPASVGVWRFAPLAEREAIVELLAAYPLRWYHRPAFVLGRPIETTLTFTNVGSRSLRLPGLVYADGLLSHGAGVAFVARFDSPATSSLQPRGDALRLDTTLPPIVLEPGEEKSVTVDLARLFTIDRAGFYHVELQLDGFPDQLTDALIVLDPSKDGREKH